MRGAPGRSAGLSVSGDFIAGGDAGLAMPSPTLRLRVNGNFPVAINDNSRYDMIQSTLVVGALAGSTVELEVMSIGIGPMPAGLDRTLAGHYPIGTVQIAGSTVYLVDGRDNDGLGQAAREALYVDTLEIAAGATLNTNGCRVYYNTLVNNGVVDDPENLMQIGSFIPGDIDGDGDVDLADLAGPGGPG